MAFVRKASGPVVDVYVDGVMKIEVLAAAAPTSQTLDVTLGLLSVPSLATNAITYDNVTVRAL